MSEIDNLKKYGNSFQTKVISGLLSDKTFLERIYDILNKEYFESNAQQWLVEEIVEYFKIYKTIPTLDVFKVKVQSIQNEALKTSVIAELKVSFQKKNEDDIKYVTEEFLSFCKTQKLKQAIMDSVDLIKNGQSENIRVLVENALKAGAERNIGHDYNNDINSRMSELVRNCIKTGWKPVDELTDGGIGAGELGVIIAPPGIGKSWLLCSLGAEALKQGKNVLHVTLELNEMYVGRRYDACFTGISSTEVPKKENYEQIKEVVDKIPGKLIIKYFPAKTITAQTIKLHIEKTQSIINEKIDLLIVDYADILRPVDSDRGSSNHINAGNIYVELRSILGDLQIPGWTASQSNRSGADQTILTADHVGESYGKIATADVILSLSRKINDKLNGTARIHFIKNRFGLDGMTFNARMDTSNGKIVMFLSDSEEGLAIAREFGTEEESTKKYLNKKWEEQSKFKNKKSDF